MEKEKDYNEIFKQTFDDEKMNELTSRWDDEDPDVNHKYTRDEIMEIGRLEGRRRLQNIEEAKKLFK